MAPFCPSPSSGEADQLFQKRPSTGGGLLMEGKDETNDANVIHILNLTSIHNKKYFYVIFPVSVISYYFSI